MGSFLDVISTVAQNLGWTGIGDEGLDCSITLAKTAIDANDSEANTLENANETDAHNNDNNNANNNLNLGLRQTYELRDVL